MKKTMTVLCVATLLVMMLSPFTFAAPKNVKVVNNERQPIPVYDVDNPVLQPFQWGVMNVEFDPSQGGVSATFTVPAGKRLVIEHVSGNVYINTGDVVHFSVSTYVNGELAHHQLLPAPLGPAGGYGKSYTASQNLRLYADGGTVVTLYAGRTLLGPGAMHTSISGYLVDME